MAQIALALGQQVSPCHRAAGHPILVQGEQAEHRQRLHQPAEGVRVRVVRSATSSRGVIREADGLEEVQIQSGEERLREPTGRGHVLQVLGPTNS